MRGTGVVIQTVGNRGAVVMVAELAELSEAAVQERASRLDQLKVLV